VLEALPAATQQQPQLQHHHPEPWGGLSCYELWSACAYAVQGVVGACVGECPPQPGGLEFSLASLELHGFLVRLAAGWWSNPGTALRWLAAGLPGLSTDVPAEGRVLEAEQPDSSCGQGVGRSASGMDAVDTNLTDRSGDRVKPSPKAHLSTTQLQYCLGRLSDVLQQAGASEEAARQVCTSVQERLAAERACASRCTSGAAAHEYTTSTQMTNALTDDSNSGCRGPTAPALCIGGQGPCKPCMSGRCSHQLMIAIAGAEGLAMLGVSCQCLVDWVYVAMGINGNGNPLRD
jgi:hypothetical protein